MKIRRAHLILGVAIVGVALVAAGARTRAVQEWYDTVKVEGKVSGYLLDDRAAVDGLLLDNGQQIRVGPRLGAALASRIKKGETISAIGRGGRTGTFGRLVNADAVTFNGQTVTMAGEPEGRPGPRGRGGRGREDGPGGPRGPRGAPPMPPGRGGIDAPPPPRAGADAQVAPEAPGAPPVPPGPGVPVPPAPPQEGAGRAVLPSPPVPADPPAGVAASAAAPTSVTIHGTVAAYLVGHEGEVIGLALNTGEQVRFPPRVGERVTQSAGSHADVAVTGDAVRGEYGIIVRPAQLTVGSQTILVR